MDTNIAVFRGKGIRKTIYNNEWWSVVEDAVLALTDSKDPSGYNKDMRRRDEELSKVWRQIATLLWTELLGGSKKSTALTRQAVAGLCRDILSRVKVNCVLAKWCFNRNFEKGCRLRKMESMHLIQLSDISGQLLLLEN